MSGFEAQTTIARPIESVWRELSDIGRMSRWMKGVDAVQLVEADAPSAGATLAFTARGKERRSRILVCEAPVFLAFESVQGGVTAVYRYSLEALDAATTRLTLDATCTTRGLWRVMQPVITFAMKKADAGQPEALRALVEG